MDRKVFRPGKCALKNILGYFLLGISAILLVRSLLLCFSNDIWYDELFTVGMIGHSYGELIGFTARDVHPPLYYMITKLIVDLCKLVSTQANIVAVAKTVSTLPYFLLLLYSVTFVRKRFGIFAGGLFFFCTVTMPQLSGYTVEMRMYSWALLFVTAAFLHGYGTVYAGENAVRGRLHGAAFACYGLAAAYTQYFACVAVIMVYLYVLAALFQENRSRIKEWFVWVFVSVIGYVPWLFVLHRQITAVSANYWILPLSWRTFGGCVKFLMKPAFADNVLSTALAVVMTAAYAGVLVRHVIKVCGTRREFFFGRFLSQNGRCLRFALAGTGVPAGVVLFGFAASALVRPIFVYRYMIPALGCFWLSFALGLDAVWDGRSRAADARNVPKSAAGRPAWLPGLLLLFVVVVGLRDYRAFMGEEEYKIRLMHETEEALSAIAPGDIVLYNFDQVQAVTSWYLPAETESYLWRMTPEILIQDIIRPYDVAEDIATLKSWCGNGRNVWFIGSFNSRDEIVEEWEEEGLRIEETGSYLLERYWFNLYKINI